MPHDITEAFDRVWHTGHLHKVKSYGVSVQVFGLILTFFSNRNLRVDLYRTSLQENPVNAGLLQVPFFSDYMLMTFLMMLYVIRVRIIIQKSLRNNSSSKASSPARRRRRRIFFKNCEAIFAICDVNFRTLRCSFFLVYFAFCDRYYVFTWHIAILQSKLMFYITIVRNK